MRLANWLGGNQLLDLDKFVIGYIEPGVSSFLSLERKTPIEFDKSYVGVKIFAQAAAALPY